MVWQPEIEELEHRKHLAEQMGGPEGIERQHKRGKLTVRERIAVLADPGSFQETGVLAGSARYEDDVLVSFTPANSVADAIASGKQAALALHTLFNEDAGRIGDAVDRCRVGPGPALSMEIYRGGTRCERAARVVAFADINPDYFPQTERHAPPALAPDAAAGSFDEAVDVLAPEAALAEAARCFNCGICNDCDNCRIFCPEQTVRVAADGRSIDLEFCKGCGVCTVECPRGAMDMEEESA